MNQLWKQLLKCPQILKYTCSRIAHRDGPKQETAWRHNANLVRQDHNVTFQTIKMEPSPFCYDGNNIGILLPSNTLLLCSTLRHRPILIFPDDVNLSDFRFFQLDHISFIWKIIQRSFFIINFLDNFYLVVMCMRFLCYYVISS